MSQRLVTPEQLDAALRAQSTWGSRVGSNLVKLGALDLDTLAGALSQQYGVPAAYDRDFASIQPTVLQRLPRRLVEKYLAVPLALHYGQTSRMLSVALADPDAVAVVDELAFAAGMRLNINVAPEMRILQYLEKRFAEDGTLMVPLRNRPEENWHRPVIDPHVQDPRATPASLPGLAPLASDSWLGEKDEESLSQALTSSIAPWRALLDAHPEIAQLTAHETMLDPAEVLFVRPPPSDPQPPTATQRASPSQAVLTPDEAMMRLAQTLRREEVGELILRFLEHRVECALVLVISEGAARGWRGFGTQGPPRPMTDIVLPMNSPSCLRMAYEHRRIFRGAPSTDGDLVHRPLWRALRCEPPREVLVAPILIGTRAAGLVYCHLAHGAVVPAALAEDLPRVSAAAANALVRLQGR